MVTRKGLWLLCLGALAASLCAGEAPERVLQQADELEQQGKATRAVELYRAFLKDHPNHSQAPEARYRLAKCLDGVGWVDEAIQQLETVIKTTDKRYRHRQDAFHLLGKLHASLKNYERATELFEKMLAEGAGLYEDEVLSLCGGYYALLKKYDEAAAKFNILKRRENSRYAEEAAYKLAVLWLRAENLELAVDAVEDLATRFPTNKQARGLMLQIADLFRKQRKLAQAIAVCDQLRTRFPKAREAEAAGYVLGLCYRDRKDYEKAIETLDAVARVPAHRSSGLAAEALVVTADILYGELAKPEQAMPRYEEASTIARDSTLERRDAILERCYFRLAEHHYGKKNWSVAVEYYLLLRKLGSNINILPRILKCQAEMDVDEDPIVGSPSDIDLIKEKIQENAGTFIAAEAEVFLLGLRMADALKRKHALVDIIDGYESVLKKYPKDVLAQDSLESFIHTQMGRGYALGETAEERKKAIPVLEKALAVDPKTPYKTQILETMAQAADSVGDKRKAFEVYERLFAASAQKVQAGEGGQEEQQRMSDYLKSVLTRAEQKDSIDEALRVAHGITQKSGPFSDAARHAMFYMGDLYYLRKDFSTAAKTFQGFIKVYGPRQDPNGDVVGAPWKPPAVDEKVEQIYEAAVRVAHCWYMQGHTQNMVKAYQWLLDNFSYKNRYVAEARYWLALEHIKGKKGKTPESRLKMAEELWTKVVNPSFDFADRDFAKRCFFWVDDDQMQKYVKAAILKAGEVYGERGEHQRAADIFRTYLDLYPAFQRRKGQATDRPDPMYRIAQYALGREYIALGDIRKMIETYRVYVERLRDDDFRVSALQLLGHHATKDGAFDSAIEAYATLLDEYGQNEVDAEGKPVPVPEKERLRHGRYNWDGIRLPPPKGLDLGQVRFALGFLYWKKEEWANCVKTLAPFVENPQLFENPVRPKALYMAGQSYYHEHAYDKGLGVILKLIRDHPRFEAIEEAYVYAARGCAETGRWSEVQRLAERFLDKFPRSPSRPHMDLYAARATLGVGKEEKALALLTSIAESDTYQDVRADAYYHLGTHILSRQRPNHSTALICFEKSLALYPRETAALAGAKCCIELKQWDKAKTLLERTTREFPTGNRKTIEEAQKLLPTVLKQVAKQP